MPGYPWRRGVGEMLIVRGRIVYLTNDMAD